MTAMMVIHVRRMTKITTLKLLYFILNISVYCDHFIIMYLCNTVLCIHIPIKQYKGVTL